MYFAYFSAGSGIKKPSTLATADVSKVEGFYPARDAEVHRTDGAAKAKN